MIKLLLSGRPRFKWPRAGTCRVCGCTDRQACPEGCWWVDAEHTVCSTCGGTDADLAYVLAWVPRIWRRKLVYITKRTLVMQACAGALRRYGKRLAEQEHG